MSQDALLITGAPGSGKSSVAEALGTLLEVMEVPYAAIETERLATAPAELVAQRVAEREPDSWPGKAALVEHARERAEIIPRLAGIDHLITTVDRAPAEVATEVRDLLAARFENPARSED